MRQVTPGEALINHVSTCSAVVLALTLEEENINGRENVHSFFVALSRMLNEAVLMKLLVNVK